MKAALKKVAAGGASHALAALNADSLGEMEEGVDLRKHLVEGQLLPLDEVFSKIDSAPPPASLG